MSVNYTCEAKHCWNFLEAIAVTSTFILCIFWHAI